MKNLLIISVLLLSACGQNKNDKIAKGNSVVFYDLKSGLRGFNLDTLNLSIKRSNDTVCYSYTQGNKECYSIFTSKQKNYIVNNNSDTVPLRFCNKNVFRFSDNISFPIVVFCEDGKGKDGGVIYYISNKYGLILKSSVAWNSHKRLLCFPGNDSATVISNLLSDQCFSYEDWRDSIRNCAN